MLDALCKHARFDLELACKGDTYIDDHHTVEDCAIAFGEGKEVEGVLGGWLVVVWGGCVRMDGLI
jgi:imidazoleglycerol phosphate dehydratase HisB